MEEIIWKIACFSRAMDNGDISSTKFESLSLRCLEDFRLSLDYLSRFVVLSIPDGNVFEWNSLVGDVGEFLDKYKK